LLRSPPLPDESVRARFSLASPEYSSHVA
jgi:hypothetical protein